MKHLLKGAATTAIVLVISLVVHVVCNVNGISLYTPTTGTLSAVCAVFIYNWLLKKEKS